MQMIFANGLNTISRLLSKLIPQYNVSIKRLFAKGARSIGDIEIEEPLRSKKWHIFIHSSEQYRKLAKPKLFWNALSVIDEEPSKGLPLPSETASREIISFGQISYIWSTYPKHYYNSEVLYKIY